MLDLRNIKIWRKVTTFKLWIWNLLAYNDESWVSDKLKIFGKRNNSKNLNKKVEWLIKLELRKNWQANARFTKINLKMQSRYFWVKNLDIV